MTFILFYVSIKLSCSELKFAIIDPRFDTTHRFFPSIFGIKEEKKQHIEMVCVF